MLHLPKSYTIYIDNNSELYKLQFVRDKPIDVSLSIKLIQVDLKEIGKNEIFNFLINSFK